MIARCLRDLWFYIYVYVVFLYIGKTFIKRAFDFSFYCVTTSDIFPILAERILQGNAFALSYENKVFFFLFIFREASYIYGCNKRH